MDENPCDILTTAPGRTDACKHGHVDRLPRLPPITPDYTRNLRAITLWNTRCCAPARLRRMSMSPINRPWRRRGPDPGAQEHGSGTDPASGALPARPRRVPPKPRQYPLDMRVLNFFSRVWLGAPERVPPRLPLQRPSRRILLGVNCADTCALGVPPTNSSQSCFPHGAPR